MTRMMTRSMYKKLSNEGPRMFTRSMTKNMPQKRFHDDPYPPTKRQRMTQTEESTYAMWGYMAFLYVLLMIWYIAVISWFVWFFHYLQQGEVCLLLDTKPFYENNLNNTCAYE
jgi:hypothetical protein